MLAALLTAPVWSDRILGASKIVRLPIRTTWLATGNNLTFSNEIARRTVWIRMEARTARPHLRTGFRHQHLDRWIRDHRSDLIWAGLVLVQHWIAEGSPRFTGQTLGTFEPWAETIGGILTAAGIPGFLENLDTFTTRADEETTEWERFVRAWWHQHGAQPVETRRLLNLALVLLPEVVRGRADEHAQLTRLGIALKKHVEWILGDFQIIQSEVRDEQGRERHGWALRPAPIAGTPCTATPLGSAAIDVHPVAPAPPNGTPARAPRLPPRAQAGDEPVDPGRVPTSRRTPVL